jgi:hypothetical protein
MKMNTPKVAIIANVSLVVIASIIVVCCTGCEPEPAAPPVAKAPPQQPASTPVPAPVTAVKVSPVASGGGATPSAVATVSVPSMEEIRELTIIEPGTAIEVVSLTAGRIQVLDDKDEILAEVTGETPWIRCHAALAQTLYKVKFQPANGALGIQRVFALRMGQANSYVRIFANPKAPAKIGVKQQATPFAQLPGVGEKGELKADG